MKTLLLSIFYGLFPTENKASLEQGIDKIFLTMTDATTGRTLIIEEGENMIWAYMLRPDKEEVDFEGFLCTVVSPKNLDMDSQKVIKKDSPLPVMFSNPYSYIKNLKKKDITVHWQKNCATILIKDKVYLIMDMNTKISYSKGLSRDCEYGKRLKRNTYAEF